jgi:nucleoside-diphosphate-sugar epimerase
MGPRDEQFLPLFRMAKRWGLYTTAGDSSREYSLIGAHDLTRALCAAVEANTGLNDTYYATMPSAYSWNTVADEIGKLAQRKLRAIRIPEPVARTVGAFGSAWMSLTNRPTLLNGEKVTEMLATGWSCSGDKISSCWGFECEQSLADVVRETWDFYAKQGWL